MESSKRQIFLLRDFRNLFGFCVEIDRLGFAYHMLTVRLLQVEHSQTIPLFGLSQRVTDGP